MAGGISWFCGKIFENFFVHHLTLLWLGNTRVLGIFLILEILQLLNRPLFFKILQSLLERSTLEGWRIEQLTKVRLLVHHPKLCKIIRIHGTFPS